MLFQLVPLVTLTGLAMIVGQVGRQNPARRARQEAAWRDLIRNAGLRDQ